MTFKYINESCNISIYEHMNLQFYINQYTKVYITYIIGSYTYCQIMGCTVTYLHTGM